MFYHLCEIGGIALMLMGIVYDFWQVFARGYSTRKAAGYGQPAPRRARDTMGWDDEMCIRDSSKRA